MATIAVVPSQDHSKYGVLLRSSDVPTSYWASQYIEALAASGITVGVTLTTFEPESNVTRAQMAVFLAKALGLHWPN